MLMNICSFLLTIVLLTSFSVNAKEPITNTPFISNTTLDGKIRTVYYDVHNSEKNSSAGAWTGGLWLNFRSGYLGDILGVGASFYGVTKLDMSKENKHSYQLLNNNNEGFAKLGQIYGEIKLPSSFTGRSASFTVGRQTLRTGLISGSSSRSTPSTWSGYNLKGAIESSVGNLEIGLALVDQMSLRNEAGFHDITNFSHQRIEHIIGSEITYTLPLSSNRKLRFKYRNAFARDFLQAHNGDILFTMPVGKKIEVSAGVSYYQSRKDGSLWEGKGFNGTPLFDDKASVINLHASLKSGSWYFRTGISKFDAPTSIKTTGSGYSQPGVYYYDFGMNTHGTWDVGTTGFAEDMLYDGETVWMGGIAYDFSEIGLKGLEAGYAFHYGSGMHVISPNGQKINVAEHEHDILLVYAFPQKNIEGLKFKLKYGLYRNDAALRKAIGKEESDLRIWLDYDFLIF